MKKTIALWQFLLLTKFKICTVLPRNIMAVYEEDELHCYRSITSKFCLTATYRCLCFELYFWNSPKLLAFLQNHDHHLVLCLVVELAYRLGQEVFWSLRAR